MPREYVRTKTNRMVEWVSDLDIIWPKVIVLISRIRHYHYSRIIQNQSNYLAPILREEEKTEHRQLKKLIQKTLAYSFAIASNLATVTTNGTMHLLKGSNRASHIDIADIHYIKTKSNCIQIRQHPQDIFALLIQSVLRNEINI